MQPIIEKRRHERQKACIPIQFNDADSLASYTGVIINLSKGGAYMTAPACLEIGNQITLQFNNPATEKASPDVTDGRYHGEVRTCHILSKSGEFSYGVGLIMNEAWSKNYATNRFSSTNLKPPHPNSGICALRKRAEDFISRNPQTVFRHTPESIQQLVHELYIHQVELQMQSDELRRAQLEIEVALSQYADLYDLAPVGYLTLNSAGVIEKANLTAAAMLGLERSRLVKTPLTRYVIEDDRDILWHHRRKALAAQTRQICELRMRDKTGNLIHTQLQSSIEPHKQDKEQNLFTIVIDVTNHKLMEQERRLLEKRLTEAKKLEAVGTLAGGVAHDFNNLMMAIQGSVSLIRLDLDEDHPHARCLAGIETEIRGASKLTRQLLAFSRGGKYEIHPVHINAIINSSLQLFARTHKNILIHTDLKKNLAAVEADASQLKQVFLNLFLNAGDAMPHGGRLEIRTRDVLLDDRQIRPRNLPEGNYICITVADTGIGMDENICNRIFEPFFTTKKMQRGTGLGLASAYGTIHNHDGIIEVRSRPAEGTTFTIILPTTDKKVVQSKDKPHEVRPGAETLLVVDDEPVIRNTVSQMLEHLGYTVLRAANGEEAIAIYRRERHRISLVLLDMTMPEMDGGQTFDHLQSLDAHVKVLLASGFSRQGRAEDIIARGCRGFIQKPYSLKELSHTIRTVLDEIPDGEI